MIDPDIDYRWRSRNTRRETEQRGKDSQEISHSNILICRRVAQPLSRLPAINIVEQIAKTPNNRANKTSHWAKYTQCEEITLLL